MTREEAIADFKEEVENAKTIVRAYKNNGLTIKNVERTIDRDEMAISALSEELSEDGTLTVHVSDGSKVNRVFVMGDNIFGGLYYPDSAEIKGDLISRQAVLDIWHTSYSDNRVENEEIQYKKIAFELPSAENKGEWIPVSERLPEKFRFVNCTCHSLIDDREDWVVETVYVPQPPNSPYSDWGNIPMLNDKECEVTAWVYREIPEPYKKGE